jgi:hypothetical protein
MSQGPGLQQAGAFLLAYYPVLENIFRLQAISEISILTATLGRPFCAVPVRSKNVRTKARHKTLSGMWIVGMRISQTSDRAETNGHDGQTLATAMAQGRAVQTGENRGRKFT